MTEKLTRPPNELWPLAGASISRRAGGLPPIANLQNEPNLAAIAAHPKSDRIALNISPN